MSFLIGVCLASLVLNVYQLVRSVQVDGQRLEIVKDYKRALGASRIVNATLIRELKKSQGVEADFMSVIKGGYSK